MKKISQKLLQSKVEKNIREMGLIVSNDIVYVGLSGGADSVCLFDILFNLQKKIGFTLKACHYNHNLRGGESLGDQKFVEDLCQKRGVELVVGEWKKNQKKIKNELEAREARYGFFESIFTIDRGEKIALAHNANDLCETFFMRIIRGSGLSGMRSIPAFRKKFIRPLLPFSRFTILAYLKSQKVDFREDLSNINTKYFRNEIRHQLLPQLIKYNPNLLATVATNVEILSNDYDYIRTVAEEKYCASIIVATKNEVVLSREKLVKFHPALQFSVLRLALSKLSNLEDISLVHLKNIIKLIEKGEGKKGLLLPHSLQVALKNGKIHLLKIK